VAAVVQVCTLRSCVVIFVASEQSMHKLHGASMRSAVWNMLVTPSANAKAGIRDEVELLTIAPEAANDVF
jgi:hypothetical protein